MPPFLSVSSFIDVNGFLPFVIGFLPFAIAILPVFGNSSSTGARQLSGHQPHSATEMSIIFFDKSLTPPPWHCIMRHRIGIGAPVGKIFCSQAIVFK